METKLRTTVTMRLFANVSGVVYVAVGLLGFALTGFDGFAAASGETLVVFEVNPLHNVVHLLVGMTLLAGAVAGERSARVLSLVVGAGYAVVGAAGLFVADTPSLNVLALNGADNLLHLATAAAASGAVLVTRSRRTVAA